MVEELESWGVGDLEEDVVMEMEIQLLLLLTIIIMLQKDEKTSTVAFTEAVQPNPVRADGLLN